MNKILLSIGPLCVTATLAFAHSGAMGVVKERMDGMGELGKSIKAIAAQFNSAEEVDVDVIKTAAKVIQNHSGQTMLDQFPEGSHDKPTEARAEIWQDWIRFSALANRLNLQAQGLAMAAGNPISGKLAIQNDSRILMDYAAMAPDEVYTLIGQTCADCHKDFRLKK